MPFILLAKIKCQDDKPDVFFFFLVVWESEHWNRHLILKRISEYVLLQHLSLSKENIVHIVDQLDFSLLHGVRGNELATEYFKFCQFFLLFFSLGIAQCFVIRK